MKNSYSFTINAEVLLPQAVLTDLEQQPILINSLEWVPPVAVKKSRNDVSASLLWRSSGSEWQKLSETGLLKLTSLDPGIHTIEITSQEEGFWQSLSPVSLIINFQPDYEKIISSYISEILSGDFQRRNNAQNSRCREISQAVCTGVSRSCCLGLGCKHGRRRPWDSHRACGAATRPGICEIPVAA